MTRVLSPSDLSQGRSETWVHNGAVFFRTSFKLTFRAEKLVMETENSPLFKLNQK